MSGICGIVRLDGGTAVPAEIDAMCEVLKRRGPDGTRTWIGESTALGHTLLATTPEALVEQLPLTDPASGCTITADVRLDNREELLATLGIDGDERIVGDGELILRSYLRWGEDCPKHLLGDFAFAIWDPRTQSLFAARDHMGMRPFAYSVIPNRVFVFGCEEDAVLAHPLVPTRINASRIGDYLEGMEGMDFTSTFFANVRRLPPAHSLTVSTSGLSTRRYWKLQPGPELLLGGKEDYASAFLAVLTEAVRCRLRSIGPVGAMVSGGVDSNAVAAIAARLLAQEGRGPLRTFSAVGPDPGCPETRCIRDALSNPQFQPTIVDYTNLGGHLATLSRHFETPANPFDLHMTMLRAVYLAAHRDHVKIVLDGAGGDLVLVGGNRIAALIGQGKLREAIHEARREVHWVGTGFSKTMLGGIWVALVPRPIRAIRQRLSWLANDAAAMFRPKVNRVVARKIGLRERRAAFRRLIGTYSPASRDYRLAQIGHPHTTAGRERYDRAAGAFAVEPRDPFLDRRVVEFCLTLPASELKSDGWPKLVLRKAVAGLVPDSIRWREGKSHLGLAFTRQLLLESPEWQSTWPAIAERVRAYTPKAADRNSRREVDFGTFIELFALGRWLMRYARCER